MKTSFLPRAHTAALDPQRPGMPVQHPGTGSAGIDYPALADGRWRFLLSWRTLPWDHAPGALFITEAGGLVARLDGSAYRPDDRREGLLVASDAEAWRRVRGFLPPGCADS